MDVAAEPLYVRMDELDMQSESVLPNTFFIHGIIRCRAKTCSVKYNYKLQMFESKRVRDEASLASMKIKS